MKKLRAWLLAARPRTLPLSISGILVGTAMANGAGYHSTLIFVLALLTTIAYQVTSNFANDYGDGVRGTDDETRIGPQRALQSGILSKKALKSGIFISVGISVLLSAALIFVAFRSNWLYVIVFLFLGIFSVWAALKYTMGSSPYGYRGMGDIFVFVFFGLLSVLGSYFLYTKSFDWLSVLPAVSIGLLCVGVLNLNNLRDVESDRLHGKNTVVVKMGFSWGKRYHTVLLLTAFLCYLLYGIISRHGLLSAVYLLPFGLVFIHLRKVILTQNPENLNPELKKLALSTFFIGLLLYISLNYFL